MPGRASCITFLLTTRLSERPGKLSVPSPRLERDFEIEYLA